MKISFLKPVQVYMENFSQNFPKNSFTEVVSYRGKFRKIPREVCSGGQTKLQHLQYSHSDTYKYQIAYNA